MKKISYITDDSTGIEIVSSEDVDTSFPPHTHTSHYVLGIVTAGKVCITVDEKCFYCRQGEYFSVAPDTCHSIKPESKTYSMISICIPSDQNKERNLGIIRKCIMGNPEMEMTLAEFSNKVNVSKFHMIRKFKDENGMTPHKFQIQCRIRKAQKLLAAGERVVDVAQMVGFYDQSHLDREFKKLLGISPEDFSKSAILSKASI